MEMLMAAVGVIGLIGTLFGILVAIIALSAEKRSELKKVLRTIWRHLTKTLVPLLMALVCVAANCWEIYQFSIPDSPPTRGDVLLLLINIWNAVAYFFFGMVLFLFWLKDVVKKEFPIQAQT